MSENPISTEPTDDPRVKALGELLEVAHTLAAEIDLTKILTIITEGACKALHCERASVFQYDAKREQLYTRVVTELEIAEIRKGIDLGITGYVARSRKIANIPDPAQDARWDSTVDKETGFVTRSILATPVISPHDGALLGVLEFLNNIGGPFDRLDEQLAEAFTQHVAAALDRARLVEELRRREQAQASLEVARAVQRSFMPQSLPEIPGYEIGSWWRPNEEVGGDYCDVVHMSDGRTALVIADVSGHGLGPSLLMASVRAALRALLQDLASPQTLLEKLSRTLSGDLQDGRFVTMVLAALDHDSHRLQFANAGHGPALHYSAAGDAFTTLAATGFPLGVVDDTEYELGESVEMAPGDVVLLCTDGIVEAVDRDGRPFGEERLRQIIRSARNDTAEQLVRQIGTAVEAFYEGDGPSDDLTVLGLRRVD
ncbi:MAG: PP2C family protein-serine/threonine phosphatase [Planctomycetes bacterium]|nr:PP2C family protein-serine/threonine phosphatase [Planctomycetota bacterium]